jgi:hypothetical protein
LRDKDKGIGIDLDITPDAEISDFLDRNSGHGMKGKGWFITLRLYIGGV